jgi:hypothetical protein
MRAGTLVRLAVAGTRTDTVRIVLTGFGSALGALALLSAATVLAIRPVVDPANPDSPPLAPYTNGLLSEPGLRPGLTIALVLLTIPVLLFVGQCARLGAPARDRRLAAIRLAGATPRQGLTVAAGESGLAALLGTVLGLAVYLAGRRLLDAPDARGLRPLPTDVLPHWDAIAGIVLGLPVIATLATALLLRRVAVTPLGVVRRVRRDSPRPWPGILIVVGVAAYSLTVPVYVHVFREQNVNLSIDVLLLVLLLGGLSAAIGVVAGAGWISYTVGRLISRYARGPAALIAGRRLQADPWSGSRALAALLAAVMFAGGAAWITSWYRTWEQVQADSQHAFDLAAGQQGVVDIPNGFYLRAMQLVGYAVLVAAAIAALGLAVAVADSIVERRRALASLTASGVPRSVLGRAVLWQALGAAVPALVLAMATGLALAVGYDSPTVTIPGTTEVICTPPPDRQDLCQTPDDPRSAQYTRTLTAPGTSERVRMPWAQLGLIGGWALGAAVLTAGLGLVLLRASTAPEELRTT